MKSRHTTTTSNTRTKLQNYQRIERIICIMYTFHLFVHYYKKNDNSLAMTRVCNQRNWDLRWFFITQNLSISSAVLPGTLPAINSHLHNQPKKEALIPLSKSFIYRFAQQIIIVWERKEWRKNLSPTSLYILQIKSSSSWVIAISSHSRLLTSDPRHHINFHIYQK